MKLVDLQPKWWGQGERHGVGVSFLCPSCVRGTDGLMPPGGPVRLGVAFANPLDGGPPIRLGIDVNLHNVHELHLYEVPPGFHWRRTGDTFETLTLSPSVDCSKSGHWHGYVTAGEVT